MDKSTEEYHHKFNIIDSDLILRQVEDRLHRNGDINSPDVFLTLTRYFKIHNR